MTENQEINETFIYSNTSKGLKEVQMASTIITTLYRGDAVRLILSKYKPNSSWEDMLSLVPGVYEDAVEMKARGEMYNTKRPWLYWPGGKATWYDEKVTRWARQLGAKKDET